MATEVNVPTLGESIVEATVGEWLKQPGDPVKADEPIVSLETDKVAVEVPSPVAGVMGQHAVNVGDRLSHVGHHGRLETPSGRSRNWPTLSPPSTRAPPARGA